MAGLRTIVLAIVALSLSMLACRPAVPPARPAGAPGRWVMVEAGETLGDIARRSGVPEEDLLELNGLRSAADVQPGRLLFVLDPTPGPPAPVAPAPGGSELAGSPPPPAQVTGPQTRFRWPVDAPHLTSLFGTRWGRPHDGIDLNAPIGTPVLAAGTGEVVYAGGALRGYGNMVVLKHEGGWMTVYAHNSVLLVKVGDHVHVGQRVALSGQSGHATGPHVHFEVRKGQVPRDPLPFLPDIRFPRATRERTPKS